MIEFDSVSKQYEINHRRAKSLRDVFSFNKKPDANAEIFKAVDDVSFSIDSGKSVGVLGRNGAGKSTLLKLLTRIISPTSGKITVDGSISCLLEVGAGVIAADGVLQLAVALLQISPDLRADLRHQRRRCGGILGISHGDRLPVWAA